MFLTFDEFRLKNRVPDSPEEYAESLVKKLGYENPTLKSMAPGAFLFKVGFHHVLVVEPETKSNIISKLQTEYPKQELGGYVFFYITGHEMTSDFLYDGKYLTSIFKFDNFNKCKKFISDILELAGRVNHYPIIQYDGISKVTIKIFTHETDSVTEKDTKLAEEIVKIKNRVKEIYF